MTLKSILCIYLAAIFPSIICADSISVGISSLSEPNDTILQTPSELKEIVVNATQSGRRKLRTGTNTEIITSAELKKAACCNLGESFTTNPSVDVSYTDAATGARQIKLLGLGGQYVQMLTENYPNFRGAASAYGLGYMPGPWMSSIQVSKGASSVKNGYESVTGQINIEMLKPQNDQSLSINAYANQMGKGEFNATGNLHFGERWKGGVLLHAENSFATHDGNGDSFIDAPKIRQLSGMTRWIYQGDRYVMQAGVKILDELRESGQIGHNTEHLLNPYTISIDTRRWEAFTKNAYIFDRENSGNVALILSGSLHDQDSRYGKQFYNVDQKNIYASLMFEQTWRETHALSTGISLNGDYYGQTMDISRQFSEVRHLKENETTPGVYVQYTFTPSSKFTGMAGLRYDHSSIYGSMLTPRLHLRWNPIDELSLHASAGKGYRSPHPYADNTWLLASARSILIDEDLHQEEAWNFGGGLSGKFHIGNVAFDWNAEYYYTNFLHQTVVDLNMDPHAAHILDLTGKSFSHSALAELSMTPISELTLTLAGKMDDVRIDFGRGVEAKPLHSRWKGLFTASYAPMMGLWQFDVSLAINGGGKMPVSYADKGGENAWARTYKAFPQLNAQITRNFRHWSIYAGGENLTGYRQKMPVIGAGDPWGNNFDATMVYGPIEGAMIYVGFRYNITKY
ncbi:MAG: TonB-dependent receptor [Muribaculaceae bacterium]|nr:TonB-dependent receptor [Muribaculaceae bacterium]